MAMENIRKQNYKDENRNFQEEWFENYGFIDNNGKSLSLICNIIIKNYKFTLTLWNKSSPLFNSISTQFKIMNQET